MRERLFRRNYFKSREYYPASRVRLVHSGKDYFDTLEDVIASAKHTIHLQTYIFEEDAIGKRIANALKAASLRGVSIALLLDGFGSKALSHKFVQELRNTGIDIRFFAPFFSTQSIYLGRRMHHKIVVVDKSFALIGGINIADKYHGSETEEPWLDYAILLQGSVCGELELLCHNMYGIRNRLKRIRAQRFLKKQIAPIQDDDERILVKIKQNDRLKGKNQISRSYIRAIRNAHTSIYITGSYFLPGTKLRKALVAASKRGVEVNLILAGVSDVPMFQAATTWLYDFLFRHGIKIYEWKKSVLHGKIAVIDDNWSTVGSFNLNHLSAYGSIELNIDVPDEVFVRDFKEHLQSIIESDCEQAFPEKQNRKWTARLGRWFAYQFTRTFIKIMVVFPYVNPFKKFE
ncbi:MAG: cardiolipin synthase ClsB [Bacteroidia bacterium]